MTFIAHDTLVWLSKSIGLFYLLILSAAVVVYAYWPANRKSFERAAKSIIEGEDRPWG
ncbi:MAG: cbb3-type cytochrome c oxidase subunit 3 [Proteobacteria bacterium]|nr:cbb3-type cytochrome c oxidase subunit 3 [Pseudomonadota bacterium]